MDQLITSVESAIKEKNWYAALSLALTLPDIAGKLDSPEARSSARYTAWVQQYLVPKYTSQVAEPNPDRARQPPVIMVDKVFLPANDCYALRCAYLHEGSADITNQRIQEVLEAFDFISPPPDNNTVHKNSVGNKLQLQVDIFCNDIISGIWQWLHDNNGNAAKLSAMDAFLKVREIKKGEDIKL